MTDRRLAYSSEKMDSLRYSVMRSRRRSVFAPTNVSLFGLAFLFGAYFLIGPRINQDQAFNVNLFGPLFYAAIMAFEGIALARRSRAAILSPIFAFYGANAAYFGFGAISPLVTNEITKEYLFHLGIFGDAEMLKLNMIVTLFTLLVLGTIKLNELAFPSQTISVEDRDSPNNRQKTLVFAVLMLAIGIAAEWLIFLPSQLGLFEDSVPALFAQLINFVYVGIFLLTYWCLRYRPRLVWVALLITVFESALGFLLFSKTAILLPSLFFALAVALRARGITGVLAPLIALAFVFDFVAPIVTHARAQQKLDFGSQVGASLPQRLEYIESYFTTDHNQPDPDSIEYNWVRISYMNYGIKVIEQYDAGAPGTTLDNLFYVFVPRAIMPNKPNMAALGSDLYTRMTGQYDVSVSAGLYAEAYWNFGWMGGPILMVPFAFALVWLSRFSLDVVLRQRWIYMPAVMLSVRMGSRPDGHFILDVFGASVLILGLIIFAWGISLASKSASRS